MELIRSDTVPTRRAPKEWFTGGVLQEPIHTAQDPARASAAIVRFDPGARTNWHTHPLGQILHVLSGVGRVQSAGGAVRIIRPGDTVWIPPHEKHWHGAAPDKSMTHFAIHEALDGVTADWLEPVSDAEYAAVPADD